MKKILLCGLLSISFCASAAEEPLQPVVSYGDRSLVCRPTSYIVFSRIVQPDGNNITYSTQPHPEISFVLAKLFDRTENFNSFLSAINFSIFDDPNLVLTDHQEALGHRRSHIVPENLALAENLAPNTVQNFKRHTVAVYHTGFERGLDEGRDRMREAKDTEIETLRDAHAQELERLQAEHAKELEAARQQCRRDLGFVTEFTPVSDSFNNNMAFDQLQLADQTLPSKEVLSRLLQARIKMDNGIVITKTPREDGRSVDIDTNYAFRMQDLSDIQYLLDGSQEELNKKVIKQFERDLGFVQSFSPRSELFDANKALSDFMKNKQWIPSQKWLAELLQARQIIDRGCTQTPVIIEGNENMRLTYSYDVADMHKIAELLRGKKDSLLDLLGLPQTETTPASCGGGAAK